MPRNFERPPEEPKSFKEMYEAVSRAAMSDEEREREDKNLSEAFAEISKIGEVHNIFTGLEHLAEEYPLLRDFVKDQINLISRMAYKRYHASDRRLSEEYFRGQLSGWKRDITQRVLHTIEDKPEVSRSLEAAHALVKKYPSLRDYALNKIVAIILQVQKDDSSTVFVLDPFQRYAENNLMALNRDQRKKFYTPNPDLPNPLFNGVKLKEGEHETNLNKLASLRSRLTEIIRADPGAEVNIRYGPIDEKKVDNFEAQRMLDENIDFYLEHGKLPPAVVSLVED